MEQISFFDTSIRRGKRKIVKCLRDITNLDKEFTKGKEFEVFKEEGDHYIIDVNNVYCGPWKKDFEVIWNGV